MNNVYLQTIGDSLFFINSTDFQHQLQQLDLSVPPRHKGRKSFHRERHCLIKYLLALASLDRLRWPFTIIKFERPDFLYIDNSARLIGIEHSDFGSRENQSQLTMVQSGKIPFIPPVLDTDLNAGQIGEPRAEKPFARFALAAILRKTRLISRNAFRACDELRLLLYPNTGLEDVNIPKVSTILLDRWQQNINWYGLQQPFTSISIIYGSNEVWLDFAQQGRTPQRHITMKKNHAQIII